MRSKLLALMALLITGGLLSGCIIAPDGYWHHHHHDYGYRD